MRNNIEEERDRITYQRSPPPEGNRIMLPHEHQREVPFVLDRGSTMPSVVALVQDGPLYPP